MDWNNASGVHSTTCPPCIWTWFLIFSLARDPRVITDGGTDDYTRITWARWRLCGVMCTLTAKTAHWSLRCRGKVRPVKTQMTPLRLPTCGTFPIDTWQRTLRSTRKKKRMLKAKTFLHVQLDQHIFFFPLLDRKLHHRSCFSQQNRADLWGVN